MPEYLAPGVFIEEVPARLKAIEGVSTSTAAFVGPAERGPVPGFDLPFDGEADNYVVPRDAAPRLVTSLADFVRTFGDPLPMPDVNHNGYLSRAVKAFFENGGKRCYVARIVNVDGTGDPTATASTLRLSQGVALRLAVRAAAGQPVARLTSLRGVADGNTIEFRDRAGTSIQTLTVGSYNTQTGAVTFTGNLGQDLEPGQHAGIPAGFDPVNDGAQVYARTPGSWSERVKVTVTNADRGPVEITAAAATTADQIEVQSTGSFYRGAIVEIDTGAARAYGEVVDILPGRRLQLAAPIGVTVPAPTTPASAFARVIEIDITVQDESGSTPVLESFRALSWNPNPLPSIRSRHYATVINSRSRLIYIRPPNIDPPGVETPEAADIATQPMTSTGFSVDAASSGTPGDDGDVAADADYVGTDGGPGARTGIQSLQDIEDIRIIAAPGRTAQVVQNALISQCERMRYRFAVLDGERDLTTVTDMLAHRNSYDSSYAAYYTPWLEVTEGDQRFLVPPSGYVSGIYARTDVERGVHKAPANEVVRGITGLGIAITTGEQEILNPRGVNAIRAFEGRGRRVWGARTLSSDPEFRYVNVRRFLIFLEASLDRGTQWAVFEPNAPETWQRVTNSVTAFLHTQWRNGALFGRTPEQAFFVRCDESTMSVDDVQNGRLICEIGVAIVRPAEFVIFRIEQITGFGDEA